MVAFGTFITPSDKDMGIILDAIQELPNIGFVISIKETRSAYKIVKQRNLPNILLKNFVP